eukprot:5035295-Prymnesium_polylepis.1
MCEGLLSVDGEEFSEIREAGAPGPDRLRIVCWLLRLIFEDQQDGVGSGACGCGDWSVYFSGTRIPNASLPR